MKGITLLIAIGCILSGCGRKLPPDCRVILEEGDYGRFELRGSLGIARDEEFRIDWFRCSVGQRYLNDRCVGEPLFLRWETGVRTIEEMNEKSAETWRLPTLKELASLKTEGCGNPSVNLNVFPGVLVENYWASDQSPHKGFRCGMYTYSGATSCRLFDNLERPMLIVRDIGR